MYKRFGKRASDVALSFCALLILLPLLLLTALIILLESGRPVFFTQKRLGQNMVLFNMYKFRTMHVGSEPVVRADGTYITAGSDPRVTRFGKFLRLGFDELPQLYNIIKGDMSIVGPRPDLPVALDILPESDQKKYTVKPGLTNLPAVSGRNELPFQERVKLDLVYVDDITFTKDFLIIFKTLLLIVGLR